MKGVCGSNRYVHSSEVDNRAEWWLREYGHFPTRAQLLRIRQLRRTEEEAAR